MNNNINQSHCKKCGLCAEVCPNKLIAKNGNIHFIQDKEHLCLQCGQCMACKECKNHPLKSSLGMIFFCQLLPYFVEVKLKKMKEKITIKIQGHLNETWKEWFDGVEISYEENITVLTFDNKDQAYVHGILNKIRDLNLKLISVNPVKQIK